MDRAVARAAAMLRAQHAALRLPDALLLATAEVDDDRVLTADAQWPAWSRRAVAL